MITTWAKPIYVPGVRTSFTCRYKKRTNTARLESDFYEKRMPKPKTQSQIDKAANAHRQKKYGVGLEYYNSQLEKQSGGCGICQRPPGTRRLHIDHDHSWTKVKIWTMRVIGGWVAYADYGPRYFRGESTTKPAAIKKVKALLKKSSVRGLLCANCNRGLIFFRDRPELFRAAAKYLENHQGAA